MNAPHFANLNPEQRGAAEYGGPAYAEAGPLLIIAGAGCLTRAILFSACTTAIAFGSLYFSHHPGTSSMGKLMGLSLLTTLAAAVIFQPALMATQRQKRLA